MEQITITRNDLREYVSKVIAKTLDEAEKKVGAGGSIAIMLTAMKLGIDLEEEIFGESEVKADA